MTLLKEIAWKPFLVVVGVVLVLTLALGRSDGLNASREAVQVGGFSFGAALGFVPVFFTSLQDGRESVDNSAKPKTEKKS